MDNVAVIIGATGAVGRKILEEVLEKKFYKKIYVLGRSSVTKHYEIGRASCRERV